MVHYSDPSVVERARLVADPFCLHPCTQVVQPARDPEDGGDWMLQNFFAPLSSVNKEVPSAMRLLTSYSSGNRTTEFEPLLPTWQGVLEVVGAGYPPAPFADWRLAKFHMCLALSKVSMAATSRHPGIHARLSGRGKWASILEVVTLAAKVAPPSWLSVSSSSSPAECHNLTQA